MNRRQFMKKSAVIGTGAGISSFTQQTRAVAASDRIGIGLVGCGAI